MEQHARLSDLPGWQPRPATSVASLPEINGGHGWVPASTIAFDDDDDDRLWAYADARPVATADREPGQVLLTGDGDGDRAVALWAPPGFHNRLHRDLTRHPRGSDHPYDRAPHWLRVARLLTDHQAAEVARITVEDLLSEPPYNIWKWETSSSPSTA